jgi:uncharacterized protein YciI
MQFLLVAFDGNDPEALERRMKVRPAHLENVAALKRSGQFMFGGAILDDGGKMTGSMIVYEFPNRQALDEYLKTEPYITGDVWRQIDIRPFRLAHIE